MGLLESSLAFGALRHLLGVSWALPGKAEPTASEVAQPFHPTTSEVARFPGVATLEVESWLGVATSEVEG